MKKIIDKLNFNIDEFKNNYWYSKTIEIPQFIKNIQPDITENELFNKLLFNVFQTCDLFINQKISQFLALDLTLEQIIEILGKQRVSNFISSVYTEIKYRLATEKFPEFSQKDKLITSNFSLATTGREFNNFQSLLCSESIAYLSYPSWNDLKINKDDYLNITSVLEKLNQFDTKIEKLLKDNSESDENLKLSFSKFKSEQLEINDKKENKLSDNVRNFLNKNVNSPDYLGAEDGNDYIKITFDNDELGVDVCAEQYQTYIRPEGIKIASAQEGMDLSYDEISFPHPDDESKPKQTINYDKLKSLYENLDKSKSLENKVNSIDPALEKLNQFDTKIEKLLKDNSESDENLKLSFSKFKSEQLEINNKTKSNIEALEKSNITAKNIDNEITSLKQKDIDIDNGQKLILDILLNFTNKLIVNNESKLNLGFLKAHYEKENTQKYNVGDIANFNGKKVYIVKVDDAQTPTTSGGSTSNGYTYVFMELNSSKELVD